MSDMEGFRSKTAGGESLGQVLRRGRESFGVGIADLAERTRIQEKYLLALESGDYGSLPEPIYQRLFIKTLSKTFGLDESDLLLRHEQELSGRLGLKPVATRPPTSKSALGFMVAPRIASAAAVICLVLLSLAVLGFEVYRIVVAPDVMLASPTDGESVQTATIEVQGKTERGVELRVNGELVYLAPDGAFDETVNLHSGVNVIKISAKKTHSDERVLYRRVLWNSPEQVGGGGAVSSSTAGQ